MPTITEITNKTILIFSQFALSKLNQHKYAKNDKNPAIKLPISKLRFIVQKMLQ